MAEEELDDIRAIAHALQELRATLHASIVETMIVEIRLLEIAESLLIRKGDEKPEQLQAYRTAIAEMMEDGSRLADTREGAINLSPTTTEDSSSKRSEKDSSDWFEQMRRKR